MCGTPVCERALPAPACPTPQVMSLCDETLEERMRRGALGEPGAQLTACRELCEGLAYLHQLPEPIAHRDIKPANLLFRGAPQPTVPSAPQAPLHSGERASPSPAPFFTIHWLPTVGTRARLRPLLSLPPGVLGWRLLGCAGGQTHLGCET